GGVGVVLHARGAAGITGASRRSGAGPGPADAAEETPTPAGKARAWQVEADFVAAIRGGERPRLTDFETGVAYMEFTEAVARSARLGQAGELPPPGVVTGDEGGMPRHPPTVPLGRHLPVDESARGDPAGRRRGALAGGSPGRVARGVRRTGPAAPPPRARLSLPVRPRAGGSGRPGPGGVPGGVPQPRRLPRPGAP